MTGDMAEAMEAEFDTVAEWTAQVAADLGPAYYVPAACRGSGQPVALDWLLAGLHSGPGDLLADIGAGVGGPAAYASGRVGVRPVLVEPEPGACRAAARLFGAPVLRADATALPLADGSVHLAWCLGVLCTATGPDAQLSMLLQMRRVVRPGGRPAPACTRCCATRASTCWPWPIPRTCPSRPAPGRTAPRPSSASCSAASAIPRSWPPPPSRATASATCSTPAS
jgi:SAM-dependent methyltransferase